MVDNPYQRNTLRAPARGRGRGRGRGRQERKSVQSVVRRSRSSWKHCIACFSGLQEKRILAKALGTYFFSNKGMEKAVRSFMVSMFLLFQIQGGEQETYYW